MVEGRRMCASELQLLFFCGMTAYSRPGEYVLIIRFAMKGRGEMVRRYLKSLKDVSWPPESRAQSSPPRTLGIGLP